MTTEMRECDVVLKGGVTSGVVYPKALVRLSQQYRFRGLGGSSAGAIGAALGAAAELGRAQRGFDKLDRVTDQLTGGRIKALFQPQRATRGLFRVFLAASSHDTRGPGKAARVVLTALLAHPVAAALGALPGLAVLVLGVLAGGWPGALLAVLGLLVLLLGAATAVTVRLYVALTRHVPANGYGICRGISTGDPGTAPGLTDWLAHHLDDLAGLEADDLAGRGAGALGSEGPAPLTFGDLWRGPAGPAPRPDDPADPGHPANPADPGHPAVPGDPPSAGEQERRIDLRMMTTCLTHQRPYELPWEARTFFYDPEEWRALFPRRVMDALDRAHRDRTRVHPSQGRASHAGDRAATAAEDETAWEDRVAQAHTPPLRRLPEAADLPVVVAVRMSLSFPLLISAIPMWTVDRRAPASREALAAFRSSRERGEPAPEHGLEFAPQWFTDGGLCSNFPIHFFDAALPTRPTYAFNLGPFRRGQAPTENPRDSVEWARTNADHLLPTTSRLPARGLAAVTGFATLAINTARDWPDNTQLDMAGMRDRVVRVLQTDDEGGLNLEMGDDTIRDLAARGAAAADALAEQFHEPRYPPGEPRFTGWDNHRWVRYRALLACLPPALLSYRRGRSALDLDPEHPPSYPFDSPDQAALAEDLSASLDAGAAAVDSADPAAVDGLVDEPARSGVLRRVPLV